jgi:hypothetical protein
MAATKNIATRDAYLLYHKTAHAVTNKDDVSSLILQRDQLGGIQEQSFASIGFLGLDRVVGCDVVVPAKNIFKKNA